MDTVQNGTKRQNKNLELAHKRELFYRYLAAMKMDEDGNKVSMDEFAKKIGVDRKTLYNWQQDPEAAVKIADYVEDVFLAWLPQAGMITKKYAAKGSFQHLQLLLKQSGRLKSDKTDITTNGKDINQVLVKFVGEDDPTDNWNTNRV